MLVANKTRKKTRSPAVNSAIRRDAEAILRDMAFVLKLTAKVKKEMLAGR